MVKGRIAVCVMLALELKRSTYSNRAVRMLVPGFTHSIQHTHTPHTRTHSHTHTTHTHTHVLVKPHHE